MKLRNSEECDLWREAWLEKLHRELPTIVNTSSRPRSN